MDNKMTWSKHAANVAKFTVLRVQTKFTPSDAVSPPEATGRLLHEGYIAIGDVRFSGLGIMQQDILQQSGKLHVRAERILYGLPWDTSAKDVLTRTKRENLETIYKVRV